MVVLSSHSKAKGQRHQTITVCILLTFRGQPFGGMCGHQFFGMLLYGQVDIDVSRLAVLAVKKMSREGDQILALLQSKESLNSIT